MGIWGFLSRLPGPEDDVGGGRGESFQMQDLLLGSPLERDVRPSLLSFKHQQVGYLDSQTVNFE